MYPLARNLLKFAAAGAFVALTAATTTPAGADEMMENLGPVGPREPILTTVGSKRVIAFYEPSGGTCAVHVVVWDPADVNAESTAGFKATLNPRQMAHVDTAENKSLSLQCGDNAESLAIWKAHHASKNDLLSLRNRIEHGRTVGHIASFLRRTAEVREKACLGSSFLTQRPANSRDL
jgi:hypothetical protein